MDENEVTLTNGIKLAFDWDKIAEEYKELMPAIDINQIAMTGSYCGISSDLDHTSMIAYRNNRDEICSVSDSSVEFEEIKRRLEKLEEANDIMRTDSKAMAEGLVIRENKIKELEAENSKLKAKIEELVDAIKYCKKNGVWAELLIPQMPLLNKVFPSLVNAHDDDAEHLLDGLEIDEDEDKN